MINRIHVHVWNCNQKQRREIGRKLVVTQSTSLYMYSHAENLLLWLNTILIYYRGTPSPYIHVYAAIDVILSIKISFKINAWEISSIISKLSTQFQFSSQTFHTVTGHSHIRTHKPVPVIILKIFIVNQPIMTQWNPQPLDGRPLCYKSHSPWSKLHRYHPNNNYIMGGKPLQCLQAVLLSFSINIPIFQYFTYIFSILQRSP